jgi:hypothetical protein
MVFPMFVAHAEAADRPRLNDRERHYRLLTKDEDVDRIVVLGVGLVALGNLDHHRENVERVVRRK